MIASLLARYRLAPAASGPGPVESDQPAIRGAVIAFIAKRSCGIGLVSGLGFAETRKGKMISPPERSAIAQAPRDCRSTRGTSLENRLSGAGHEELESGPCPVKRRMHRGVPIPPTALPLSRGPSQGSRKSSGQVLMS
jgi:hypothetical protein